MAKECHDYCQTRMAIIVQRGLPPSGTPHIISRVGILMSQAVAAVQLNHGSELQNTLFRRL
jgi:hypothetical protein